MHPLSEIPSGFRCYSARDARARRGIELIAMSVFEGWSYEEVITPTVDYYSLFEAGMGPVEAQRTFKFADGNGRLLALRPDVTSGMARAAATRFARRARPLRLCYAASVFRQLPTTHANSRRETTQIGCELLGRNSIAADLEILTIAVEVLQQLNLDAQFVITINDVEIFNGIAEYLALEPDARKQLRELVNIRAIAELKGFLSSYAPPSVCASFADLIQLSGKHEIFPRARSVITNTRSCVALDRLENLWQVIEALGISARFEIDLGDVSRLDYYSGLTFAIYCAGAGARIGGGGRYDNLTAKFGKAEPAVGFVLDPDAIADVLKVQEIPGPKDDPDPTRLASSGGDVATLFGKAIAARRSGSRVLIDCEEVTSCPS